jgi:G3E family GTPase
MEFSLYGAKFNYEYGNVYRLYEYKKGHEWKRIKIQNNSKGYKFFEFRVSNKRCAFLLHRLVYWLHNPHWDIFDSSIKNNSIDHIDRNPLNNNIENLRVVTNQENHFNQTRTKGYYWFKRDKKWRAQIQLNGKKKHLGIFDKEIDARNAYLEAKKKYHIIR